MAKATTTIKQVLNYEPEHGAWFAANQALFNQVAAFYFGVIQAHEGVLDLSKKEALTALEKLTHTTEKNSSPVMPLSDIVEDIPAMFRRAAIHAALGSARSFYSHLSKWPKRKAKAQAVGKKFTERPPGPPRSWNKSATLYAGQWKERTGSSILLKIWTGTCWSWVKIRITGWMKGRIFKYSKYKAYNAGILTSRVNPRNTSRECARCHSLVARYAEGHPAEGYTSGAPLVLCPECGMHGNADRNEHGTAQERPLRMDEHL